MYDHPSLSGRRRGRSARRSMTASGQLVTAIGYVFCDIINGSSNLQLPKSLSTLSPFSATVAVFGDSVDRA